MSGQTRVGQLAQRLPLSTTYLVAVSAGVLVLARLDPAARSAVLHGASTNLHNLRTGRLDTLATSAMVLAPPAGRSLLVGSGVLTAGEWALGSRRALTAFGSAHVLATLAVAGLLEAHVLPGVATASVRAEVDVGLSYGVLGVAAALAVSRPRYRAVWLGAVLALVAKPLLVGPPTSTAWGHLFAALVGGAVGIVGGEARGWAG